MSVDNVARAQRRRGLLNSLKATRTIFVSAGDFVRASRIELGIQILLDQRVSDRMIDLMTQSAAIVARDAAELTIPVRTWPHSQSF